MQKSISSFTQDKAYKLVIWQMLGVLLLAAIGFILYGFKSSYSIFLGGCAYTLPNLVFVWRVFRYAKPSEMTLFLTAFMLGEAIKLVMSGILVLMIVKTLPVSLLSVIIGFMGAIVSFWIASLLQFGKMG